MKPGAQPTAATMAAAKELLSHCDIADVRPTRIDARLLTDFSESIRTVAFNPTLEHASGEGAFRNRFTFAFSFDGEDDKPVASMEFTLIVEWTVSDDYTPTPEAAEFVTSTTGYFAAFPYVRELAQATTARLGLDPVVLGILNRNDLKPESVRVVVRGVNPEDALDNSVSSDKPSV